jgi:hypothetical protein
MSDDRPIQRRIELARNSIIAYNEEILEFERMSGIYAKKVYERNFEGYVEQVSDLSQHMSNSEYLLASINSLLNRIYSDEFSSQVLEFIKINKKSLILELVNSSTFLRCVSSSLSTRTKALNSILIYYREKQFKLEELGQSDV